jgi:hypothetical protein
MATEMRDVRRAAQQLSGDPTRYNEAMKEMLDYAKRECIVPRNPRRAE